MSRPWVIALVVLAVVGAGAAMPFLLRNLGFFRVRQVEMVGVRYLSPDSVVAALGLRPDQNVFDNTGPLERRAQSLPGVVGVTIERKLPGTLRITVLEREPVAFAPGPDRLVALDGDGRPLPYNAAATGLDLPLIARVDTVLLRTLSVVRLADSSLFRVIDGASREPHGGVVLEMNQARLLWPGIPTTEDVRAVGAVRRHLASTGRRYAELDARFGGWIVVRRTTT